MKKSKLIKAVREVIEELNSTGVIGAFQTPNAFSKGNRSFRVSVFQIRKNKCY